MAEGESAVTLHTYSTFSPCIVPLLIYHTAPSFNDTDKGFKNRGGGGGGGRELGVGKRENAVVLYMYEIKM